MIRATIRCHSAVPLTYRFSQIRPLPADLAAVSVAVPVGSVAGERYASDRMGWLDGSDGGAGGDRV